MMSSMWTAPSCAFVVLCFVLSQGVEGKLQCPDKYCVMCLLPPNRTAEQVYGKKCLASKDCSSADHLCCRRDNFGTFCTKGIDDTPRAGQCPQTAQLPLGDRVSRCPADMGHLCSFDADCPLNLKCCYTACGHKQCSAAVPAAAVTSAVPAAVVGASEPATAANGGGRAAASAKQPRVSVPPSVALQSSGVRQSTARPLPSIVAKAAASTAAAAAGQKGAGTRSASEARRTVMEMLRARVALLSQKIQIWKDKALRLRQLLDDKMGSASAAPATPAAAGAPAAVAASGR